LLKPALPRDVLYEILRALAARAEETRLPWNWKVATHPKLSVERRRPPVDRQAEAELYR
jgi:hypothetical protein